MNRQRVCCCAAAALFFLLLSVGGSVLTARQEPAKPIPEPRGASAKTKEALDPFWQHAAAEARRKQAEAALDKMFGEYDLKPHGLPAIPDDPPPHEGAMIGYPEAIEPPDLILIEVLEAVPGRPISGERLVRPDGTISLGWYGNVHVAGLTLKQAKVKIIQHLRRFLTDEVLGLYDIKPGGEGEIPGGASRRKINVPIPVPPDDAKPLELDPEKKPKAELSKTRAVHSGYKARSVRQGKEGRSYLGRTGAGASIRLVGRVQEPEEKKAGEPQKAVKIPLEAGGQVTITIEVRTAETKEKEKAEVAEEADDRMLGPITEPADSDRVFVDITAYNSKNYYIEGDLTSVGRLPFTGRETVMDAIVFGGGLLHTAEPKDIRLVRPARGGKPARIYKVDLEAIREKGDVTSNYQIFPDDRLIVGRNDVVKKTIQVDRLAAGMHTIVNSILQESFMLRSLQFMSPENHDVLLARLVEFWIQEMKRPGGVELDEQTLRDALIRRLQLKPEKK